MPVDAFDKLGKRVTQAEIDEVRQFMTEHIPQFGSELQELDPAELPNLFRLAVDEMRRMQAGHPPRYV